MQRKLIAIALTAAPISLAAALVMVGASMWHPAWWEAGVKLAVLSGISSMIYGINFFALPFHARRPWRSMPLVALQLAGAVVGGWMTALGIGMGQLTLERCGLVLAAIGGSLFQGNVMLLMTQPAAPRPPRPAGFENSIQHRVDRLATSFTITAGLTVVFGTALGAILGWWHPSRGRWDLVWAHSMLLGFFFAMASGTSYHTLARWAGREWPSLNAVRIHRATFLLAFPAMLIGLATDIRWVLLAGGVTMAISMVAWAWNVVPVSTGLAGGNRYGIWLALACLLIGAGMGVWFVSDPAAGARLRPSHVFANLFGFGGLLISGFGYKYVPQLAGRTSMAVPTLVMPQLSVTGTGVGLSIATYWARVYGHTGRTSVLIACIVGAVGLMLFAVNVGATFRRPPEPGLARQGRPDVTPPQSVGAH